MIKDLPIDKFHQQGEMLANRVKKKFKHLKKKFAREQIDVFRLYDWDIPEIRAVVDWYDGHLVIGEYTRRQTVEEWLPIMAEHVAEVLGVPDENIHLKARNAGWQNGARYERLAHTNKKIIMRERDLQFLVNPYDYVDTGLFSDHRNTRVMVRDMAKDKDFLNLYCYSGAFTCYAAKGGAKTTVSVDRSETAILWTIDNLMLNNIPEEGHTVVKSHTPDFLEKARRKGDTFDLVVVDPPSYSSIRTRDYEFDISVDHPELLEAVIAITRKGGTIFFSTNHQAFTPIMDDMPVSKVEEITHLTIPEDYINKKKQIHRCWKITV